MADFCGGPILETILTHRELGKEEPAMQYRIKPMYALLGASLLLMTACAAEVAGSGDATDEVAAVSSTVANEVTDHNDEEETDHDEEEDADHDQTEEPAGEVDRVVEVELNEFSIEAASLQFLPGETVEFVVTNTGVVEHELRLSNQERVEEHLAGGHDDHDETMTDDEMAEMEEAADEHDETMNDDEMAAMEDPADEHEEDEAGHEVDDVVLTVAAGETSTMVFTFPDNGADYTAAVCLIPGHYEAGMTADLSLGA